MPLSRHWILIATLSGAAALSYESVWLRRLGLVLGGSAVATAITLAVFMGGLGIGAFLAPRIRGSTPRSYAMLEIFAALWAALFPWMLPLLPHALAALLPLPAAVALGATWPLLARSLSPRQAATLYAANTFGAVLGVAATTFVIMPGFGVRAAELAGVGAGLGAAWWALNAPALPDTSSPTSNRRPPTPFLFAAFAAGASALGLEVLWMRLASVGLGATVQTLGLVLTVFLGTTALGAHLGRTWPRDARAGVGPLLLALAGASVLGAYSWGTLPYLLAAAFDLLGAEWLWLAHALLAVFWMAGAPLLSGVVFSTLLRASTEHQVGDSGAWLYAVNTIGSTLGAPLTGLLLLPWLGPSQSVLLLSALVVAAAIATRPEPRVLGIAAAVLLVGWVMPPWNARLYAVGVHLKLADFEHLDAAAIDTYATENWELLHYAHGRTAAVAVGRSLRTGNVWLSINGKFDASTGDDMPTQELSAQIPLSMAHNAASVGIVGLASGVTAGTALQDERVEHLDVFELEPAVVEASHYFDHVNGRPLDDPRTQLWVDDARAAFQAGAGPWDVLISEPSNPWITGVSNLFTLEYWTLARSRLRPNGVFCQWVQLYGMGPDAFRALVRTYVEVFGDVWLYETIPGSDVLLVAGPPPIDPPVPYTLDPDGVRRLGGVGWLNTDDHPRIEWAAPQWLYYDTAEQNAAQILRARR